MAARHSGDDDQQTPDEGYALLAEIAERLATEIAAAEPDWIALAHDAEQFAREARARGEPPGD